MDVSNRELWHFAGKKYTNMCILVAVQQQICIVILCEPPMAFF